MQIEFEGEVFRWSARREDWYFATLPADVSELIRQIPRPLRGFAAVRAAVRIGASSWRTSIFPDAERGIYVLPLKRAVQDAEVHLRRQGGRRESGRAGRLSGGLGCRRLSVRAHRIHIRLTLRIDNKMRDL